MIVDASAVLAVLRDDPDAAFFVGALADRAVARRMSAANYLEAAIVIDSAQGAGRQSPLRRSCRQGGDRSRSGDG